jgi:hypothetical protein
LCVVCVRCWVLLRRRRSCLGATIWARNFPRGGRKKTKNPTNVRTYFICPGLDFCTRTMT